jgi:hypothetical protein
MPIAFAVGRNEAQSHKKAEALIGQNWTTIEKLAQELWKKKCLTGKEVHEIVGR